MNLGDTYVFEHLWVVASLPSADGIVLLNLTSWRSRLDDENCIIQPGEHPFLTKKTIVEYKRARVFSAAQAAAFVAQCKPHKPMAAELLVRVQEGALVSDLTPGKVQDLIAKSLAALKKK